MDDNSAEMVIRGSTEPTNYAFSGKVMLATVLTLAVVCIIISFFHMYARWFLIRRASTHHRSSSIPTAATMVTSQGLGPIILKSLPTFTYSSTSHTTSLECIICLAEFEEFETFRLLPKCNHCFHLECIDLWFHSHTNCPLCRSPVQSQFSENPIDETADVLTVIVEVPATDLGRDRVSEGLDLVSESERGSVFKPIVEPVRLVRRFLSI